ncbi:hypothetical protein MBLNU457_1825t2 [Dothideomycetes sp. NU457]
MSSTDSGDEDFKAAIALSMASPDHGSSEDEDLKKAIALSMATTSSDGAIQTPNKAFVRQSTSTPAEATDASVAPMTVKTGIAVLDRKAMEQERLARQASRKRERPISPPQLSRPSKSQRIAVDPSNLVPKDAPSETLPTPDNGLQYPRGVVKKTWAFGCERTGGEIKIEEVLERKTLQKAVLSAFCWDSEWLLSKIDFPRTKLTFVMQGKTAEERQRLLAEVETVRSSLDICFPSMAGNIHCMHSKLMLLFHPHKVRVAVPSANLVKYDWGETGIMENSVFLIDLPRLPSEDEFRPVSELTSFAKELMHFVDKQGLRQNVKDGLLKHDWSGTRGMAFVHTVGGPDYGLSAARTGILGLSKAVKDLGLESDEDLQIDFAASSIGSLNDDYMRTIHAAARGRLNIGAKSTQLPVVPQTDIRDRMRIYFPTHDTVRASIGGEKNGGTIWLAKNWFEGAKFPRPLFRDYQSTRAGLLSHNKVLYARGKQVDADGHERPVAWVYMGSSNMSESAWGKVTFDRSRKEPKIGCRNWECGVLLPVSLDVLDKSKTSGIPMDVFKDVVDVPFKYPGEEYQGRDPWYYTEYRKSRG